MPKHYHVFQDETFEVVSGLLTILLNGQTNILTAEKKTTLPKNTPHKHFNNEEVAVSYIHTVISALDFDYMIENLVGLIADGIAKNGKYGLVQQLVTLIYFDNKSYLADFPIGVQIVNDEYNCSYWAAIGLSCNSQKYSGIEQ